MGIHISIDKIFGNNTGKQCTQTCIFLLADNLLEWKENIITDSILQLIARLSSKVFLGDELCRNEAWLETSKNYTVLAAGFARMTSFLPRPLKRVWSWFVDDSKLIRNILKKHATS